MAISTKRTAEPVKSKPKGTTHKAQRKRKTKTKKDTTKGWTQQVRRYLPGWPMWVGGGIVAATCYFLLRAFFSSPVPDAVVAPKGYTVRGIDVSHHQGPIDWELLRNEATLNELPLAFAFIKATEGSDIVDSRFRQNFAEARKYGIMRGAYHFYRTTTPAKRQAQHFISHVELLPGDLPPVLDVEVAPQGISAEAFRQGILEWLARVEQHYGVRPILYTYYSFRQQYLNDPVFDLYPYWIAHYHVDSVRYKGAWAFWQHADNGQLPGIKEKVDLNIFNGTYHDLEQLAIPDKSHSATTHTPSPN